MSEQQKGQPPLQTFRDGAVVVKLWRQDSPENGPFVSATIGRTYRDPATGAYRDAQSLSGADMLRAQALLGEAHREALKWRQYFRETDRRQDQPAADRDAAPDQGFPDGGPVPDADPGAMARQRDAAMANAAPAERRPGRAPQRER